MKREQKSALEKDIIEFAKNSDKVGAIIVGSDDETVETIYYLILKDEKLDSKFANKVSKFDISLARKYPECQYELIEIPGKISAAFRYAGKEIWYSS